VLRLIARVSIPFAAVLAVSATCITAGGPTETRRAEFRVVPGALVSAEANNATFIVHTGLPGLVTVSATLRNAPYVNYNVSPSVYVSPAPDVMISAHVPSHAATRANSTIALWVPADARLRISTTSGSIEVDAALAGGAELITSDGDIVVRSVRGDCYAETTNGDVSLEDVRGTFTAKTTNGAITFSGELSSTGTSRMETTNGSIVVVLQGEPDLTVEASTKNGPITAEGLHRIAASERSLVGTYGAGTGRLELAASLGSIDVRR